MLSHYLPTAVNRGPWITAYTLNELRKMTDVTFVLPVCSLATPYQEIAALGEVVLPPLFHEALNDELKGAILARIRHCFPTFGKSEPDKLRVVELPSAPLPQPNSTLSESSMGPADRKILAFSVDTAVEEHGPHLPLATDTIQSYGVLGQLAGECKQIELCRPLEYGQMTWGLPFGFSIDLTAELLGLYVANYVGALVRWKQPDAIYVVDVHGSISHRGAIVRGLQACGFDNWAFRWLHEPLAEFASRRGDQHAGGVETALVERTNPDLIDRNWWPSRMDEIAVGQLSFARAVELTPDLDAFMEHVNAHSLNGIVGDVHNYADVDAEEMFQRMMTIARQDIDKLSLGSASQTAGEDLW